MRVLITGGTGFIGSRLALRCLEIGHETRILGLENTEAEAEHSADLRTRGADVRLGSVTELEDLEKAVKGVDVVFHLAAKQHEMNIPDQVFHDVNVRGTVNVIGAAEDAGVRRVVYGSTIGVYGIPNGIIDETSPTNPDNIYGVTKLEAERIALAHEGSSSVVVIRIPEIYGPGDRRLVKLFRPVSDGRFLVIGNGRNLHHLLYVEDLVEALLTAAETPRASGEVILLAGPRPVTTDEMVEAVAAAVAAKPPRLHLPLAPFALAATVMELTLRPLGIQPPLHRRRLDFFRKSFELSTTKAKRVLGWEPQVDFVEGARRTAEWYRSRGILAP